MRSLLSCRLGSTLTHGTATWRCGASIRKKPTDRARALIVSKLEDMRQKGHDPNDALRRSTMSNWTSVFPANQPAAAGGPSASSDQIRRPGGPECYASPYAEHAEKTVLGCIIRNGIPAMHQCLHLRPEHFYHSTHRDIFRACQTILEQQNDIDVRLVAAGWGSRSERSNGRMSTP